MSSFNCKKFCEKRFILDKVIKEKNNDSMSKLSLIRSCQQMALFLKTKISLNEVHVSSSFRVSFHPFSLKFGKNVAQ